MEELAAVNEALKTVIEELQEENFLLTEQVKDLRYIEGQKNLLEIDNLDLQHKISELQIKIAGLRETMDGMAEDMGLLEVRVMELMGND